MRCVSLAGQARRRAATEVAKSVCYEIESEGKDVLNYVRSSCRVCAVFELLLEEDASLLVVPVEQLADDVLPGD